MPGSVHACIESQAYCEGQHRIPQNSHQNFSKSIHNGPKVTQPKWVMTWLPAQGSSLLPPISTVYRVQIVPCPNPDNRLGLDWDSSFSTITGLNGSGKSNILAICFTLGITNMSQMRAQNQQDLIYKHVQAGVAEASVTIVFDNSEEESHWIGEL